MHRVTAEEAEIYVRMELKSHGMGHIRLVWNDRFKRTYAVADAYTNTLEMSPRCCRSAALLKEITLHEMAHFADYAERGTFKNSKGRYDFHGKNWKKWCKHFGVRARLHIP